MVKYLIVDDEPIAHRIIEKFCAPLDFLQRAGNCDDAFEAMTLLNNQAIDLMFLDINMPHMKGLELLKTLPEPPVVIITSAYQEYALESYELAVCDYLLKPFSEDRFRSAIEKARQELERRKAKLEKNLPHVPKEFIFVRANKKIHKLPFNEVKYVESFRSYIVVYLDQTELTLNKSITDLASLLPADRFVRVHRSFIVPIARIQSISGNNIELEDRQIPMGKVYRADLLKLL